MRGAQSSIEEEGGRKVRIFNTDAQRDDVMTRIQCIQETQFITMNCTLFQVQLNIVNALQKRG